MFVGVAGLSNTPDRQRPPKPVPEKATGAEREYTRADFRIGWRGQLNRVAMVLLIVVYPMVVLALAGGLLWLCYWLVTLRVALLLTGSTALFSFLMGVLLLYSLLLLVTPRRHEPPPGVQLREQANRALFELLKRVAKRLNAKPPALVLVEPGASASIGYFDIDDEHGRRREHVLVVGAQDVLVSSAAEFTATICHELAHAAAGDTVILRGITRFYMSLGLSIAVLHDDESEGFSLLGWLTHLPLMGLFWVFTLLYLYDSRLREYRADRVAAQFCGPQHTRDMLRKTYRFSRIPELDIGELLARVAGRERPGNLYDEFRTRLANVSERRWQAAENEVFQEPATVWSTHPNLADRFRKLANIEAPELPVNRPARDLFLDWDRIENQLSGIMLTIAKVHEDIRDREVDRMLR